LRVSGKRDEESEVGDEFVALATALADVLGVGGQRLGGDRLDAGHVARVPELVLRLQHRDSELLGVVGGRRPPGRHVFAKGAQVARLVQAVGQLPSRIEAVRCLERLASDSLAQHRIAVVVHERGGSHQQVDADVHTAVHRQPGQLDDVAAAPGAGGLQVAGESGQDGSTLQQRGARAQHLPVERVGEAHRQAALVERRLDQFGGLQCRQRIGVGDARELCGAARLGEGQVQESLVQFGAEVGEAALDRVDQARRSQGELGQ